MLHWALSSPDQSLNKSTAGKAQKDPWRQRKLLELILFDQMIIQIRYCTEEILAKIREALRNPKGTSSDNSKPPEDEMSDALFLSQIDSKTYFFFSRQWQTLEKILQLLEEDLTETLLKVSSWETREKDRGPERPRWTRKDERTYRGSLRKMLVSNSQNVAQLRRLQANVQSLRASLSSKRDSIRDDLSLRGSEDVRYFTEDVVPEDDEGGSQVSTGNARGPRSTSKMDQDNRDGNPNSSDNASQSSEDLFIN
ncbi:hypothetical protein SLS56_011122 [Neofusicoccum ribis]|uniref:Uncharacterized protein n=1 Tax=Neofusicoccum ribis TaxID=45134 RepID=A0ABR3SCH7_9PEZI